MIKRALPVLCLALAALFLGIALYITIAEQPSRLALGDAPMLAAWKTSFEVGFIVQGTMTILTGICGIAAWRFIRDWRFMAGGLLMLANWPWTLVMMAPVNNALKGTAPEAASAASRALIEQWGQLHSIRAAFALMATLLFAWALARRQTDL
jgi:hypothetical protein